MSAKRTISGAEKWHHPWTRHRDFWETLLIGVASVGLVLYLEGWSASLFGGLIAGGSLVCAALLPPLQAALNELRGVTESKTREADDEPSE